MKKILFSFLMFFVPFIHATIIETDDIHELLRHVYDTHHHQEILKSIRKDIVHLDWATKIFDVLELEKKDLYFSKYSLTNYGVLFVAASNPNLQQ